MLGRPLGLVAVVLLGTGCGSHVASGRDTGMLIPACRWPAEADARDPAASTGCEPNSMFQICGVPSGSFVHADGTITTPDGTSVTCDDPCRPTEYAMFCRGAITGTDPPVLSPVPTPAPSLGCRVLPLPTPANLLVYCCACAPGG